MRPAPAMGMPGRPPAAPPVPVAPVAPAAVVPDIRSAPKPDALIYAIGVMIMAFVWRIQDIFAILATVKLSMLAQLTAIALFMASSDPRRKFKGIRSPIFRMVLGLVMLMVLSVPFGLWPGQSFRFLRVDFSQTLVLITLIAASVRSERDLFMLLGFNYLGGTIYAYYAAFKFQVGMSGRLGDLYYYDANDISMMLLATMALALVVMRKHGLPKMLKIGVIAALPIFMLGIVRAGSRGAFLGFLVTGLYMLFRLRSVTVAKRVGAVAAGVVLLMLLAGDSYWKLMRTMLEPEKDYNFSGNSETGRMELWKRGFGYMAQRPLLGVGVRNYTVAEGELSEEGRQAAANNTGWKWSVAHNAYVEVGVEVGVPAGLLFIACILLGIRMMDRWPKNHPASPVAQALAAALIAYTVCSVFLSSEYFAMLYVLLGFVIALQKVHDGRYGLAAAPGRTSTARPAIARPPFAGPPRPAPGPRAPMPSRG